MFGSSQMHVTSALGDPTPSSGLQKHFVHVQCSYTDTRAYTCIKINLQNLNKTGRGLSGNVENQLQPAHILSSLFLLTLRSPLSDQAHRSQRSGRSGEATAAKQRPIAQIWVKQGGEWRDKRMPLSPVAPERHHHHHRTPQPLRLFLACFSVYHLTIF